MRPVGKFDCDGKRAARCKAPGGSAGLERLARRNPGVAPDLSDLKLPDGAKRYGPDEGGPIDLSRANLRRAA